MPGSVTYNMFVYKVKIFHRTVNFVCVVHMFLLRYCIVYEIVLFMYMLHVYLSTYITISFLALNVVGANFIAMELPLV